MVSRRYTLAVSLLVAWIGSTACQAAQGRASEPPRAGKGVAVSARLVRDTFDLKGQPFPSWRVELTVSNGTAQPVELGSVLTVLATTAVPDQYLATYVMRMPRQPEARLKRMSLRYGLDWGVEVPKDGGALWPLSALGAKLDTADAFLLLLMAPHVESLEGSGYGRPLPAHSERSISETVLFPFDAEIKGERNTIVVVPPVVRPTAEGGPAALQAIFRFDVKGTVAKGQEFKPAAQETVPLEADSLRGMASDTATTLWRRVYALNWLVESHPQKAGDLLLRYATDEKTNPLLRNVALLNLGLARVPSAVQPVADALRTTDRRDTRLCALMALGDLGDASAAPMVRPFMTNDDEGLVVTAMEAAGSMKDAEAVPTLLKTLADKRRENRHPAAATALAAIGGAATDALLATVRDRKASLSARRGAALALGSARVTSALPVLAAVTADEREEDGVRVNTLSALEEFAGPEAVAGIQAAAQSKSASVRRTAIQGLVRTGDSGAIAHVMDIAERPASPARQEAIEALQQQKVAAALPVIRRVAGDATSPAPVRTAAIVALGEMKDKEARAELLAALSDQDSQLYQAALRSVVSIFGTDAMAPAVDALRSRHSSVRAAAATSLRQMKGAATAPLWAAYPVERDRAAGEEIATTLVELGFSDQSAVPVLISGLDEKKNPLWFENVKLLRLITRQTIGPDTPYSGNEKERAAELAKWRQWWGAKQGTP